MYLIGVDQDNTVLRREVVAAGAKEFQGSCIYHTDCVALMAVAGKVLFLIAGIEQFNAAQLEDVKIIV